MVQKNLSIALGVLILFAGIYAVIDNSQDKPMVISEIKLGAQECTQKLAVECAVDIERTIKACATAFETQGADIIADIKCARDLMADKKHCWPCICYEAKKKQWHIIGC